MIGDQTKIVRGEKIGQFSCILGDFRLPEMTKPVPDSRGSRGKPACQPFEQKDKPALTIWGAKKRKNSAEEGIKESGLTGDELQFSSKTWKGEERNFSKGELEWLP